MKRIYNRLREIYLDNLDPAGCSKVLDIGCGSRGNFLNLPEQLYVGIDRNAKLIRILKSKVRGEYICMNAEKLNFPDNYFDYIISTSFFHHIGNEHCQQVCQRMVKSLKKGGKVIIADGVYPDSQFNLPGRIIRFLDRGRYVKDKEGFKNIFLKEFEIQKEYYFLDRIFAYSIVVLKPRGI
ncbi:MAG: class I SAM-dependent methyltransferase [PVC group bacterium]|nr:class I SAM-dependent methyltransferase [PVC group bacterium]